MTNILIVEDEESLADPLALLLRKEGFDVILGAAGIWAGRSWLDKTNPATTATLSALYLGAFGASHVSVIF